MAAAVVNGAGGTRSSLPPRAPGFFDGAGAFVAGVRFLASRRDLWPFAAVPCIVASVIALPLGWLAITRGGPWLAEWLLPDATRWYSVGAHALVRWVAAALGIYLAFWMALLVAPVLSAPALERLVRAQEAALGLPARPRQSLWFELACGLEAQLGALLLAAPAWLAHWLASVLVPGAVLVLLPLSLLPLALGLAWNLLDYPLTLRGVRVRARFALLRQRPAAIVGFGLCCAAIAWVPGAALLILPAGAVGATRLAWRLLPDAPPAA